MGFVRPSLGARVASAWLLLVAGKLALGGHFDIAVRDVILAVAAFSLAQLSAVDAVERRLRIASVRSRRTCGSGHRALTALPLAVLHAEPRQRNRAEQQAEVPKRDVEERSEHQQVHDDARQPRCDDP